MDDPVRSGAAAAKTFLTQNKLGVLSTISQSQNGFPFGSIVPYDIDPAGNVYIYISLIAEHYKNLRADKRASLIATDCFGSEDPQASARATLLLEFEPVDEQRAPTVKRNYEARFPNSINYEIQHNFLFMIGKPIKVRWIGGFGDIRWFSSADYAAAVPDVLAYDSNEIIKHMNEDHPDALIEIAKANSKLNLTEYSAQMIAICSENMTIRLRKKNVVEDVVAKFPRPVERPEQAREIVIETLKLARKT